MKTLAQRALAALFALSVAAAAVAQPDPNADLKKAAKKYAKLVQKDAENPDNWYNLALAHCLLGQWSEAVPAAQSAVKLAPESARFVYILGKALKGSGDAEAAVTAYEKAVELDSGLIEAQAELGDAYFDAGRYEDAIKSYKGALKTKPENAGGFYNGLGNCYIKLGRMDQATRWFEKNAEAAPNDSVTWYNLGAIYKQAGRQDESFKPKAAEAFKKSAELAPRDADCLYQAGESAFMAERYDDAKRFLESFLKLESKSQRADVAKVLLDEI